MLAQSPWRTRLELGGIQWALSLCSHERRWPSAPFMQRHQRGGGVVRKIQRSSRARSAACQPRTRVGVWVVGAAEPADAAADPGTPSSSTGGSRASRPWPAAGSDPPVFCIVTPLGWRVHPVPDAHEGGCYRSLRLGTPCAAVFLCLDGHLRSAMSQALMVFFSCGHINLRGFPAATFLASKRDAPLLQKCHFHRRTQHGEHGSLLALISIH